MNVVFDLDGTLADCSHRLHFIQNGRKDWDGFNNACYHDKPIIPTIELLRACIASPEIEPAIWSGRGMQTLDTTVLWLRDHVGEEVMDIDIQLRPIGDHVEDTELKLRWLRAARRQAWNVDLALDDRARVVAMWRENGVQCYHVTDGFF